MKNRKSFIAILVLGLMVLINGCSLAKEDAGESASQDRMIGVVFTRESVDLFDMDAFLEDNIAEVANGKDITLNDTEPYQGRIYATIEKHGSTEPSDWEFIFEGIDGMNFFTPTMQQEGKEPFRVTEFSDAICDAHVEYSISDTEDKLALSGMVYAEVEEGIEEYTLYCNPVYQTEEGDIYMVAGGGGILLGTEDGISNEMSMSFDVSTDVVKDGVSKKESASVNIGFALKYEPEKITFYQMNQAHQILASEEYTPGEVPGVLEAEEETAYILVETECKELGNERLITREICEEQQGEETYINTLCAGEGGMLIQQDTFVVWPES